MATKIIKLQGNGQTYAPITLADATQYRKTVDMNGTYAYISVQEAIDNANNNISLIAQAALNTYIRQDNAYAISYNLPDGNTGTIEINDLKNGVSFDYNTSTETLSYTVGTHTGTVENIAYSGHVHTLEMSDNTVSSITSFDNLAYVVTKIGNDTAINIGTNTASVDYYTYLMPTKEYVDSAIHDLGSALKYKGTIAAGTTSWPTPAEVGDVYYFAGTCTIEGETYESGDMAMYNGSSWSVVNANWTAQAGTSTVAVNSGSETTLATVGGVDIKVQVNADLSSYVASIDTTSQDGVVTGATLSSSNGHQELSLSYTNLTGTHVAPANMFVTGFKQSANGKITDLSYAYASSVSLVNPSDEYQFIAYETLTDNGDGTKTLQTTGGVMSASTIVTPNVTGVEYVMYSGAVDDFDSSFLSGLGTASAESNLADVTATGTTTLTVSYVPVSA